MQSGLLSPGLLLKQIPERPSPNSQRCTSGTTHYPTEDLLELAADAIDESGATRDMPIDSENTRERFLAEHPFSGKTQHHKSKYAISAAAMIHGGVYPDILSDAAWWEADDLWTYSFFALLIYVRVAAERTGRSSEAVVRSIAERRGLTLTTPYS